MIAVSGAVLAVAAVTPQAFAGSLPGLARFGAARSGGETTASGGPLGRLRDGGGPSAERNGGGPAGARDGGGRLGGLGGARDGGGRLGGGLAGARDGGGRLGGGLGGLGGGPGGLGSGRGGPGSGGAVGGGAIAGGDGACSDVELVFARGTGEPQGLGIVGGPLARALAAELPDQEVGSFAVVYAAAVSQASAGPGATNMSQHIAAVAAECPDTRFVIGGYSQGASVTDIAMGIRGAGTRGEAIPDELEPRVAAVVVFGNPLNARGRTIADSSPAYGPKAEEFCADGDPVCGGGGNFAAHLAYPRNGDVQEAAEFAAGRINGS